MLTNESEMVTNTSKAAELHTSGVDLRTENMDMNITKAKLDEIARRLKQVQFSCNKDRGLKKTTPDLTM